MTLMIAGYNILPAHDSTKDVPTKFDRYIRQSFQCSGRFYEVLFPWPLKSYILTITHEKLLL